VPKFDVLEIVWQLISGLEHLHLHNIVHGFLTAENVLVSKKDKSLLVLTHYGFAKWRSLQPVLLLN
jgi:serine/threonine protein kinase